MLKLLPPEKVSPNTLYTLTLNIKQSPLESNRLSSIHKSYTHWIKKYLLPYTNVVSGVYELSRRGKLHMHGTISFESYLDIALFYNRMFLTTGMSMEIDTISDIHVWLTYMFKQHKLHKTFLLHFTPTFCITSKQ